MDVTAGLFYFARTSMHNSLFLEWEDVASTVFCLMRLIIFKFNPGQGNFVQAHHHDPEGYLNLFIGARTPSSYYIT
jgi:hypothetical protein